MMLDAYDSESNATPLSDAIGAQIGITIWRNKRWAVNAAYLSKAAVDAKTYSAKQALFYGYTDNASAITLANIPYSAYTLCLYYTSGNDYTLARTFPPALIDSVYYFGSADSTTASATPSVWGNHRYSFSNANFQTGEPEYKEGQNLLIIRGQTASTLVINTPTAGSPTFGGIAAIQVIKEDDPLVYTEVYTAQLSGSSAWEDLIWQQGYNQNVALPENLTNATLKVSLSSDAILTGDADLRGANLTFSGGGSCAFTGTIDCSTLSLQNTGTAVDLTIEGTLRLSGTDAPDRVSLEVAAPNTFTLAGGTLFTGGRLTAPIAIAGNAFIGGLSPFAERELILTGALTNAAAEGSTLTLLPGSPITLAADSSAALRIPEGALLFLADRPNASAAEIILSGGTLAPLGTHAVQQLTLTGDSQIDTAGITTLTFGGIAANEGVTVAMDAFDLGAIRFTSQTDAGAVFNAFRLADSLSGASPSILKGNSFPSTPASSSPFINSGYHHAFT